MAARTIRRGHPERIPTMPPAQPCVAAIDVSANFDIDLMSQRASIDLSDTIGDKAFANHIDFPDCFTIDLDFNPLITTNSSTTITPLLSPPTVSTRQKETITPHGINGHILSHSRMLCTAHTGDRLSIVYLLQFN